MKSPASAGLFAFRGLTRRFRKHLPLVHSRRLHEIAISRGKARRVTGLSSLTNQLRRSASPRSGQLSAE